MNATAETTDTDTTAVPLTIAAVTHAQLPAFADTDNYVYMQVYRRRKALVDTLRKADECLISYADLSLGSYEDFWPLNKEVRARISNFNYVAREARNNAARRLRKLAAKAAE